MALALILLWIPWLSWFGIFFAFLGVAFLWFGRRAFNESHRRFVKWGCALIGAGLAILLGFSILLFVWLDLAVGVPGQTESALWGAFRADLTTYVVATFVASVVLALGVVILPYARADLASKGLLWAGVGATIVLSGIALSLAYSDVLTAVSSSSSSYPVNLDPIQTLNFQLLYLGLYSAIPDLLLAWAYLRIRSRLFPKVTRSSSY
ncbi:MAG: hypothetical protein ACLQC7_00040 [Thermoplasmata archaeon]